MSGENAGGQEVGEVQHYECQECGHESQHTSSFGCCEKCGSDAVQAIRANDALDQYVTDGGQSVSRLARQEKPRLTAWSMKFDSRHIEAIEAGQKTVTARLRDEWPGQMDGANLDIFDDEGNFIGHAIIEKVEDHPAARASMVLNGEEGHRSYDLASDFVNELRSYYPDREIDGATSVRLIWFSLTDSPSVDDYVDVEEVIAHAE